MVELLKKIQLKYITTVTLEVELVEEAVKMEMVDLLISQFQVETLMHQALVVETALTLKGHPQMLP